MAGRPRSQVARECAGYIFALSTLALAFVLYLGWASYFVLKIFCILCAITYVAVIAIFIISGGATTFPMTTLPDRARRDLRTLVSSPLALVLALLFVAGASMAVAVFPRDAAASGHSAGQAARAAAARDRRRPRQDRAVVGGAAEGRGSVPADGAKVLIVKFNDYQCPACKPTFDAYKAILAKYTSNGQVKYVVKHYPLEPECNPSVPAESLRVVRGGRGRHHGEAQGHGRQAGRLDLRAHRPADAHARPGQGGSADGRRHHRLRRAIRAREEEIKTDAGLGELLGVNSTPTFFINGRKLEQMPRRRSTSRP